MPSRYVEIAPYAALLGTIFYTDPADDAAADALAFFASEGAAEAWPFGGEDAAVCLTELTQDARAFLAGMDAATEADAGNAAAGESLHEAYTRLFVGPNRLPAPPWGSVYTDHDSVIFGNKTLDVRAWMRENGVKMDLGMREPEDHFGLMLIMFAWAARNGVPDEALTVFLEEHLLPWSGRFLELFCAGAAHPFYEHVGSLAQLTLADWRERFSLTPVEAQLYR